MIKTFAHKGLRAFFETSSKAGIQPAHAHKLGRQLARLNIATCSQDMNIPGWNLHALAGDMKGYFSIWVNGNWRMIFKFEDGDAILVDYLDYR
jgi:toxin HigB-1